MLIQLNIAPGIHAENSELVTGARFISADKVRFREGKPEKIGGWVKHSPSTFVGVARRLLSWYTLTATKLLAIATNIKLYVEEAGTMNDITPIQETTILTIDPFEITTGLATVIVNHTAHGLLAGDYILISNVDNPIDGVAMTISGAYTITEVLGANQYTITASSVSTATDSAVGGGVVGYGGGGYGVGAYNANAFPTIDILLQNGPEHSTNTGGYGIGGYGTGTYGYPTFIPARTWSLDNWGEDLIANPRGGLIYYWDTSEGTDTRAYAITGAPLQNNYILTSNGRHLISFGTIDPDTDQLDPLLIRWSDSEDFNEWTPDETNQAGSLRLTTVSGEIVAGIKTENQILVWTDSDVHSMQAVEGQVVFGISRLGSNCGLLSPNGAVAVGSVVYWMSNHDFYIYDGTVRPLPCSVRTHYTNNYNFEQRHKFCAGLNKENHEIWFFYCTQSANEIDAYIIYNYMDATWTFGTLSRTAWIDTAATFGQNPLAAGGNGYIYVHEVGFSDDGADIVSTVTTGAIEQVIQHNTGQDRVSTAGDSFVFVNRFVPDFDKLESAGTVSFQTKRYPHSTAVTKGTYAVSLDVDKVSLRARGRQINMVWSHTGDDSWRFGTHRIDVQEDGGR